MWTWDDIGKFFKNLAGTIFGHSDLTDLRNEFADQAMGESDKLIERLMRDGDLTIQEWQSEMRTLLKDTYRAMYELAVGGRENMTQADYGRLGGILAEQYRYLDRFAADLAEGKLSLAQALYRARLYIASSTQAYERAKAASYGITLPQYPGDGSTQCLTNCRCEWVIKERKNDYACTWVLGEAEHCPDCLEAAQLYKPYLVAKGTL
jgi:hypothetical protein